MSEAQVVNLAEKREIDRLLNSKDNAEITPRQLLKLIAELLDKGEVEGKPIRMVAIIETLKDSGDHGIETYRSGCTRAEEIALLALCQAKQIEDWRR